MPTRHMARRSGRAPNRRRLIWAQSSGTMTMSANLQWFPLDLLAQFKAISGMSTEGLTIMRTHLTVVPEAAPATGDAWWIGLRISDLDDTTGAVSTSANIASPRTQPYVDWMFNRRLIADSNGNSGANAGGSYAGLTLDLRSKRKMHHLQQTLALVLDQEGVVTVAKTYGYFARVLLALP